MPAMPPLEQEPQMGPYQQSQQTIPRQSYTNGANSHRYQSSNNTAVSKDVTTSCNIISDFHLSENETEYNNYNGNNNGNNSDKVSSNGLLAHAVNEDNYNGINTGSHRDEDILQFVGDIDYTQTPMDIIGKHNHWINSKDTCSNTNWEKININGINDSNKTMLSQALGIAENNCATTETFLHREAAYAQGKMMIGEAAGCFGVLSDNQRFEKMKCIEEYKRIIKKNLKRNKNGNQEDTRRNAVAMESMCTHSDLHTSLSQYVASAQIDEPVATEKRKEKRVDSIVGLKQERDTTVTTRRKIKIEPSSPTFAKRCIHCQKQNNSKSRMGR